MQDFLNCRKSCPVYSIYFTYLHVTHNPLLTSGNATQMGRRIANGSWNYKGFVRTELTKGSWNEKVSGIEERQNVNINTGVAESVWGTRS